MATSTARGTTAPPVRRGRGLALILLSSICFGSSGVFGKPAILAGLRPEQVVATRMGLSALVLVLGVVTTRPALLVIPRGQWRFIVGYGLLGVAGVQLFYFLAAARIPVGVAILLEFTSPILVAFWVRFVRGTHLPWLLWGGIGLALSGLVLVSGAYEGLQLDTAGLLAGIGAALCSAAYFLLGEHGVSHHHPLSLLTWAMVIGALVVGSMAPPWTMSADTLFTTTEFGPWSPPVWTLLVAVALVSTVLAYLFGISALRHLPASAASVLALLEPLTATIAAWVLLHESLSWARVTGAVVLLTGAAIVQITAPDNRPSPTQEVHADRQGTPPYRDAPP